MMGITQRQSELLYFLRSHRREHGIAPLFKEIIFGLGLSTTSKATINRALKCLAERGYLRIDKAHTRGIHLAPPQYDHGADCLCARCPARRFQYETFIQALQEPAPILAGTNFKALGSFTQTCWRIGFPKPAHPETRKPKANVQPAQVCQ